LNLNEVSDVERNRILRELFSDFDVLLAQRDFEKAVEMLLKIKQTTRLEEVQELIYKQKESELINMLRKDLISAKERANTKSVHKTGKRVVLSLIKLKIYDEAIDLFIDYHKHINFETLRKIKLEESNGVYMNNVLNLFFENLRNSFLSFKEAFVSLINYCFSSYLNWCETEIEILIKKLQSQHYLGRHFHLTIENCELIFLKAKEFSDANNFEVKFMFETKLAAIVENSIREQQDILIDASFQRSKLELDDNPANNEQNRQAHLQKLLRDLEQKQLDKHFNEKDVSLINVCTSSALQFSRASLNFITDCLRVYYQDINAALVEAVLNLFKAELKIYSAQLSKFVNTAKSTKLNKKDVYNNVCFLEKTLVVIERLYFNRTSVHSKHFAKLNEKLVKFKKENF